MASSFSAEEGTKLVPSFSCENDNDDEELFAFATQIIHSLVFSMVLRSAVQLGLLEIMAKAGPGRRMSSEEIAAQLPTKNPGAPAMLERMLRLLAAFSVLKCTVVDGDRRLYGLGPVTKYLVPNEDGVSLAPAVSLIYDKVFLESWNKLNEAVLEGGIPFNLAHGTHAFEYPGIDPRFNKLFNSAMLNVSTIVMNKIIQSYKGFANIKQLVDVGGGVGHTLKIIVSNYPNIKGINYDLAHVIQDAIPHSGIEHVSGDMFDSVPSGDAIWMKWILHDWGDDYCIKLLKNCYRALPENGKLIVVDAIAPEEPETTASAKSVFLSDVMMMAQNPGGKERTEKELQSLATAAGFTAIKLACRVCDVWVMEFVK